MADLSWLANEAKTLHAIFQSVFYSLVLTFFLLGVLMEYFKWPLGQMPSFGTLVGRVLIAAILLHTFPDVMNILSDVSDALAKRIGDLNQFHLVLSRMGGRLKEFSFSWVKVKETIVLALSFLSFFLLYASVHIANAFLIFSWVLLYVFSPVLIALFVIPRTAAATGALYRSLIEVSCWKIVWSVLATLLWSAALNDLNKPGYDVNFVSVLCYNLMLAGSLIITPVVVHALSSGGLGLLVSNMSHIGVGPTDIGPLRAIGVGRELSSRPYNLGHAGASRLASRYFPSAQPVMERVPKMNTGGNIIPKIFSKQKPENQQKKNEKSSTRTINVNVNIKSPQGTQKKTVTIKEKK